MEVKNNTMRITAEEIAKLKYKHGDVWLISVKGESEGEPDIEMVFKSPDRTTLSAVAKIGQSDPFKASEVLLTNCLVYGDAKLLDDMRIFGAVSKHFDEVAKERESTIKKL